MGAIQILHKPLEYEYGIHSKNSISGFGIRDYNTIGFMIV
jgi:hypothetical protein